MGKHITKTKSMSEERLLTRNEVAQWLGTHYQTILKLESRGILKPVIFGPRFIRHRKEDVLETIAQMTLERS